MSEPTLNTEVSSQMKQATSGTAIASLILGIVAIVMSWVPIINNFSFIFALIGLILGIVGIVGVVRGKKGGKGLAIAALIVNIISIAIVIGTQSLYSAAIDEATSSTSGAATTTTTATAETDNNANTAAQETPAQDQQTTELAVGTTVNFSSGLSVTVDSVETGLVNYDKSTCTGIHVTYVNNGSSSADYNTYDWKGQDANGAQQYTNYYSEGSDELQSGSLAAGGTASGNIYFKGDITMALFYENMFNNEPDASWTLA